MALSAFPTVFELRSKIEELAPGTWPTFLDYCIVSVEASLRLPLAEFTILVNTNLRLLEFLITFEKNVLLEDVFSHDAERLKVLRRRCFLLTHRVFTQLDSAPPQLLTWKFLSDFVVVHRRSRNLKPLMEAVWNRNSLGQSQEMQEHKRTLVSLCNDAERVQNKKFEDILVRVMCFLKSSVAYARFLMLGSDLIDGLSVSYSNASNELRTKIAGLTFTALVSLIHETSQASLLIDHLYSLKSLEENQSDSKSLLSRLASSTPLVSTLAKRLTGRDHKRAASLISYLKLLQNSVSGFGARSRGTNNKGKGKTNVIGKRTELHVHKRSLITQIQDLFPDLGSGFIARLLDEYHDDTEQVTAHLLDDTLPDHLKTANHSENMDISPDHGNKDLSYELAPHSTPPLLASRRNVFDDDDFDRLAVDMSKVHVGRKNANLTADDLLADRSTAPRKAAILSALAAFEADDDERDDSYDVEDVGGTVDLTLSGIDEVTTDAQDRNEETLFRLYKSNPEFFDRSSDTRRSKVREALQRETGLTNEGLEGWAIMIARDPRRLKKLEAKYSAEMTFHGTQRELGSTAYREGIHDSGTEPSDGKEGSSQIVGLPVRRGDRGRGQEGRRSGNVAGPSKDELTQRARQRKDAGKASRANHNRRDQRARKTARGGFPA